jgi:proteasome accessory factor C
VFQPTPDLPLVTLRVGRGARWITEYYPCEEVRAEPGEYWLVALRASDLAWARRLVLGLGPEVTVVGPPELAAAVGGEARAALSAYEGETGS